MKGRGDKKTELYRQAGGGRGGAACTAVTTLEFGLRERARMGGGLIGCVPVSQGSL